jgi:phosphoribosylanthranilate isomerase
VAVDVKFCGLTRDVDAAQAASLGAGYVGVIFADSPRRVEPAAAATVLAPARGRSRAVGVFGVASIETIAAIAGVAALDVVQLHGDPAPEVVERLRPVFGGEVWAVVRIDGDGLPASAAALMRVADAIVLDTMVAGRLGGTGTAFDWERVAKMLDRERARTRVVLAGGLDAANVARAVRIIAPEVVDVSSGVERAPGIKDHARMRAFSEAVRGRGECE